MGEDHGSSCDRMDLAGYEDQMGQLHSEHRRIRLNTRLIFYPEECLEYVIVHELCHLIESSHNQQFKSCMTKFMPDWKERKRKLNGSHMDS